MFNAPHLQDHDKAREYLEALRWGGEPVCAHCGTVGKHYATKRPGVWRCRSAECRKDFSVTTKTVMESSHIKLHIWLQAFALVTASKKGVSAHQIHRSLGITYKSAWFMMHRIREAMRTGGLLPPMGEGGTPVEVDETYVGRVKGKQKMSGGHRHKNVVLSLVDRETKQVRSFHVALATANVIAPIVRANLSEEAALMTDQASWYTTVGKEFASHDTVDHSEDEYARREGDKLITTNTVENYFSVFKRGMRGVYQHCDEKHLHRYLAEFDFR